MRLGKPNRPIQFYRKLSWELVFGSFYFMAWRLLFSRWFIHVKMTALWAKSFCLGLFHVGIPGADTLMTLVIFSAAVSAANSAIYASSRMLWSMAGDHFAPARFSRVSRNGVPVNAILLTAVLGTGIDAYPLDRTAVISLFDRQHRAGRLSGLDCDWLVSVSFPACGGPGRISK